MFGFFFHLSYIAQLCFETDITKMSLKYTVSNCYNYVTMISIAPQIKYFITLSYSSISGYIRNTQESSNGHISFIQK